MPTFTDHEEALIEQRVADGCEVCGCTDDRFLVDIAGACEGELTFAIDCRRCAQLEAERDQAAADAPLSEPARRVLALLSLKEAAWKAVAGFLCRPPLESLETRADGLETLDGCHLCGRSRSACVCSTDTLIEEDDNAQT